MKILFYEPPIFNDFAVLAKPLLVFALLNTSIIFSIISTEAEADEIYKWIDEKGNVHFGDSRGTGDAEKVQIDTKSGKVSSMYKKRMDKRNRLLDVYREEREEKEVERIKAKQEKETRLANCKQAKSYLQEIQNARFLYQDTGDPFNPRILDKEERITASAKIKANIKRWCN